MNLKIIFLSLLVLVLSGCVSDTNELNIVKSYKSVNQYQTIAIVKDDQSLKFDSNVLEKFENKLFDALYADENSKNFIPGDQLSLKYKITNFQQMNKNFTDWGTYFGKDCQNFEVMFTIYDKYSEEIGQYNIDIKVEYWLFSTNERIINSAFNKAAQKIAQHLKSIYLKD